MKEADTKSGNNGRRRRQSCPEGRTRPHYERRRSQMSRSCEKDSPISSFLPVATRMHRAKTATPRSEKKTALDMETPARPAREPLSLSQRKRESALLDAAGGRSALLRTPNGCGAVPRSPTAPRPSRRDCRLHAADGVRGLRLALVSAADHVRVTAPRATRLRNPRAGNERIQLFLVTPPAVTISSAMSCAPLLL